MMSFEPHFGQTLDWFMDIHQVLRHYLMRHFEKKKSP
jgi:hypothetical protein